MQNPARSAGKSLVGYKKRKKRREECEPISCKLLCLENVRFLPLALVLKLFCSFGIIPFVGKKNQRELEKPNVVGSSCLVTCHRTSSQVYLQFSSNRLH